MKEREHENFVDELLEASLGRYRSQEPRAGLDARILASVRTRERARSRHRWVWAFAACAALLTIFALVFHRPRPGQEAKGAARHPRTVAKSAVPPVATTPKIVSAPRTTLRGTARAKALPARPEQFPTPAPLTEQEKLLLVYVKEAPASALKVQANEQPADQIEIPKLTIAAVEIKPLPGFEKGQER